MKSRAAAEQMFKHERIRESGKALKDAGCVAGRSKCNNSKGSTTANEKIGTGTAGHTSGRIFLLQKTLIEKEIMTQVDPLSTAHEPTHACLTRHASASRTGPGVAQLGKRDAQGRQGQDTGAEESDPDSGGLHEGTVSKRA